MYRSDPSRRKFVLVAFLAALGTAGLGSGTIAGELRQDMERGFYELSDEVVTPHIPWAKPYYKAETRALVIAPRWTQRETVELAQRMSLDYVTYFDPGEAETGPWGVDPTKARWFSCIKGQTKGEKEAEIREKLRGEYDTIILAFMSWQKIPTDIKFLILKKVSEGTGLVMCFIGEGDEVLGKALRNSADDSGAFITAGVPFSAVHQLAPYAASHGADSKLMKLAQLKKGRVVLLKYPLANGGQNTYITPSVGRDPKATWLGYEYAMSLAVKAILWAARMDSDIGITDIRVGGTGDRSRQELAGQKLQVRLASARSAAARLSAHLTVRSPEDEVEGEQERDVSVDPGENVVEFPFPLLPAGKHFVDVALREEGKVVNWGSCSVESTSPVAITGVSTDKERYEKTETAVVSVSVKKAPSESVSLAVELWDNFGRKLAVERVELGAGEDTAQVEFPLADCLCQVHRVKAALTKDGEALHVARAQFGVSQPEPDYTVVLWSMCSNGRVKRLVHRAIYDLGLDGIVCNASWQDGHQPTTAVPYADNIRVVHTAAMSRPERRAGSDVVRRPCTTDPQYRRKLKDQLEGTLQRTSKWGALAYSMGDEIAFGYPGEDVCLSPTCAADFREYLKKEYGSLDAVNREWGTSYAKWEEVVPITLAEARKTGRYAQWCDHRLHMDSVWAGAFKYASDICKAKDPTARVGADTFGGVSTWSACDWVKLADACDMNFNYTRSLEESAGWKGVLAVQRSLFKKGAMLGYCYGGYMEAPASQQRRPEIQRFYPWKILFEGGNAITWYALYGYPNISAGDRAFAPDLTPYPIFMEGVREMLEIKRGTAKLLLNAKRLADVAIYYSRASIHAGEFDSALSNVLGRSGYTERYLKLLEDLGLNYKYVSYRGVKEGELIRDGYRLLLMPYAQALSDEEIQRVKEFAGEGGMITADFRPGVMDGHGRMRENAPLDEVFGIERRGMAREYKQAAVTLDGDEPLTVATVTRVETNVAPSTARALAHAGAFPAAMVNDYGKGKACYLNFGVDQYASSFSDERMGLGMRRLWEKLLALSKLERRVELESDAPANLRALDRVSFAEGGAEYLGLLRYPAYQDGPVDPAGKDGRDTDMTPRKVAFKFPRTGHLYDIRRKEYLGVSDGAEVAIIPGNAHLFALLPYRVETLTLEDVRDEYSPGERIEFEIKLDTSGADPATHVARVELAGPDGSTKRYYCRNVLIRDGRGSGSLRFALNDKPGKWKLRVTDVTSGESALKKITLRR